MRCLEKSPLESARGRYQIVGSGGWAVSGLPGSILSTFALGAGIGIAAWDPEVRVAGLLNYIPPVGDSGAGKPRSKPGDFYDGGLGLMLQAMERVGARRHRLRAFLAGAATELGGSGHHDLARRNLLAARRSLWENGILIEDEACGGYLSRTLKVSVDHGAITVRDSTGDRKFQASREAR